MTFLRNCALLLPAGFLVAAFVFLISHGPQDPALAVFPMVGEWIGADRLPRSPEVSFLLQSGLLFLLPYLLWLALVLLVAVAERVLFGSPARVPGLLHRTFSGATVFFFLLLCAIAGGSTGAVKRKLRVEGPVGVAVVGTAPFIAGVVAPIPAFVTALPLAGFLRMRS
ncbi:MAG TPA: hypothetical protein VFL12_07885 [Thermoanaerobaculia bacterium]|nr:hypothetical protein [Thermoanaerobaculia bacterium]